MVVAENLVRAWTRGRVGTEGGLGPGVLICQGLEPSHDEVAQARALQTAYFEFLVNDADAKYAREGAKDIEADHRLAAEWLGVQNREWAKPITPASNKACPACGEDIKSTALVCRHCRTDIPKYIEDRATAGRKPPHKPAQEAKEPKG